MFCLSDFEAHAKKVLPKNAWDYYSSGANQEQSLRDNVQAFTRSATPPPACLRGLLFTCTLTVYRYRFRPRVLNDVSSLNLRVSLQGKWVESPIGVSPTAMQKMAHPQGEVATAQGMMSLYVAMTSLFYY